MITFITDQVGATTLGRAIIAHRGNGASVAAALGGQPLATTMGFTPTGGFMMGTRSGDLDPGLLIHLMTAKGYDAVRLEQLVNEQSGLRGVSGISPDMRFLLERRDRDRHAAEAVALFCYQLRKSIGALSAVLGGLDTLVFTGGIGEHAAPVPRDVCCGLDYLGIRLDPQLNDCHAGIISAPESRCAVRVVPTNEDLMVARHTRNLLFAHPSGTASGEGALHGRPRWRDHAHAETRPTQIWMERMRFKKCIARLIICVCVLAFLLSASLMGCANGRPPVKTLEQWEAEDNRVRSTGGN